MNQKYIVKRNAFGQSIVTSELAKSKGKLSSVAKIVGVAILGLSSSAFAETTNEITTYGQGATTQTGGTAVGVNAKADTNGTAIGQQATASTQATANGYVSAALANETIAIGVNSGAVGGAMSKEDWDKLLIIDREIKELDPNSFTKTVTTSTPPDITPVNEAKKVLDEALKQGQYTTGYAQTKKPAPMYTSLPDEEPLPNLNNIQPTTLTGNIAEVYNKLAPGGFISMASEAGAANHVSVVNNFASLDYILDLSKEEGFDLNKIVDTVALGEKYGASLAGVSFVLNPNDIYDLNRIHFRHWIGNGKTEGNDAIIVRETTTMDDVEKQYQAAQEVLSVYKKYGGVPVGDMIAKMWEETIRTYAQNIDPQVKQDALSALNDGLTQELLDKYQGTDQERNFINTMLVAAAAKSLDLRSMLPEGSGGLIAESTFDGVANTAFTLDSTYSIASTLGTAGLESEVWGFHIHHTQNGVANMDASQLEAALNRSYESAKAIIQARQDAQTAYDTALAEYEAAVAAGGAGSTTTTTTDLAAYEAALAEKRAELTRLANAAGFDGTFESLSDVFGSKAGRAIAIGNTAFVSGDEAIGVGYGNTVTGSRSNVLGTHNNVTTANNNVMGNDNNITVSEGNVIVGNAITFTQGVTTSDNIALGSNTVISAPVPTASMDIRGTTYEFAGANPTSVVTVGSEGNERQIQNVAAGRVTKTSTDAINGSQLYAVIGAVNQITASVNPDIISDMINDEAGWKMVTTSSEGGNVSGNDLTEVANGDTVTIDAGKNINITQTGQTISIATSDTPTFNNVTINEAPTEGNHATTKDYVDNGRSVVEAGDNVKVEAKTDDATGKTTYTVSADVPNVTVTGGGNVNVTTNVDDTTGDITYTIDTPNVTVEGGKNVTVNTTTNDKGDVTYTVDVNVDTLTTNVTAGDNVVVKEVADADGNKTYTLSADKTTVSSGTGIAVTSTTSTTENGATITNYEVALTDDLKSQIAKEESVTAGSDNLTVVQNGTSETGGKNFVVDLAKNIKLTPDGSLTIGDVVIAGDTINAGGNKITNVANGTNPTDAVNLSQLNASKSIVEAGDKAKVESKTNADGSTTYTVTALTTEVKGGKNAQITESVGDKGQSVYTVDVKGDLTDINSITNGGSTIKLGDANVSVEGAKITNVANGTAPTDAVNVSQLNAAKTEVKAGENVKVSEEKGANGQSIYTVSATGDLTNVTSIANGDTKVSLGDGIVNVEGNRITNVASPVDAGDAVNKDYVDNSHSTLSSVDGTVTVVKSIVNATTGAINYDLSVTGGVNSQTDDGKVVSYKLGDTITVTGDGKNLSTATSADSKVQVKLADDVKVNSVTTGNVSISTEGVNAGGKKVTNVAPATISPTSTDAVNGSQLYATNQQVINNANNIAKLGDNVQSLNRRVDNLDGKIDRVNKDARAGIAGAVATASLPQVYIHGKSMVSAATGHYKNENAIAVGYSRASDNGKLVFKLNSSANTRGDFTIGTGIGYQW